MHTLFFLLGWPAANFFFVEHGGEAPTFLSSWSGMFMVNAFILAWVLVVGFGLGGQASMTNFIKRIDTFELLTKCYQCPPRVHAPAGLLLSAPPHY
jgi:auxin influx carrier (AUX1 LAX family)